MHSLDIQECIILGDVELEICFDVFDQGGGIMYPGGIMLVDVMPHQI